jgi:hypothetical protein
VHRWSRGRVPALAWGSQAGGNVPGPRWTVSPRFVVCSESTEGETSCRYRQARRLSRPVASAAIAVAIPVVTGPSAAPPPPYGTTQAETVYVVHNAGRFMAPISTITNMGGHADQGRQGNHGDRDHTGREDRLRRQHELGHGNADHDGDQRGR